MKPLDEKKLIQQIKNNDEAGLNRFYAYFYQRTFQIVSHKLGNPLKNRQDCEDLASEIIWEGIVKIQSGGFDPEKGRLSQYMYGIINNSCKNFFKKSKNRAEKRFSDYRHSVDGVEPQSIMENNISLIEFQQKAEREKEREIQTFVFRAIEKMDEKYKKLIYLKYYEKLSYQKISSREDIPVKKVKSRLFDARRKLEIIISKMLNSETNISV